MLLYNWDYVNACAHTFHLTPNSTDDAFAHFLATTWFPGASRTDIDPLLALYPPDPAEGSPFNTGGAFVYTPQFKRIAALQGDWFFNAPRRALLEMYAARPEPAWTYRTSLSPRVSVNPRL